MRRLIGYITACIAMLLAIVVGATPVFTKLSTGREFTNANNYREIVFNVGENSGSNDNENRAQIVADEMTYRMKQYKVEDYSIKVQGNDTVTVAMNMPKTEFNYVAKYLCFSGENFGLVSSNSESSKKNEHVLFNPEDVKIEYKGDAKVPVIIIPLTKDGQEDVKALLSEFGTESSSGTTKSKIHEVKAEGEEETKPQNYIYLWANLDETRGEGLESLEKDPVSREKVVLAFSSEAIWNPDSKEAETELFYMCATGKESNPNELDVSGLKDDNERANYLENMLKAKKYSFEISCPTAQVFQNGQNPIDYFENARVLSASAETLVSYGSNSIINFKSKTFVATMVAVLIVSLLLVVFYRLTALGMIVTTLSTLFLTLLSFTKMEVIFNIPSVVGLVILTAGLLFGQILYANRLKEEIYKGRSIKKANQEASKKSNLLTVDASIILAFSGLMMYALGDTALKSLGVVLFFGAIFALLMNLLIFKLLMYMLTNSTNLQSKYSVFNVDGSKVPNLMNAEEKETYVGPYEKVDFTKRKTLVSIIFGALGVAALACIITFGAISSTKSPLNIENAVKDTTVCYVNIDTTDNDNPIVKDVESFKDYALVGTGLEEQKNLDENISIKKVETYSYEDQEEQNKTSYFISVQNVELPEGMTMLDLETAISSNLDEFFADKNTVSVKSSKELVYTPNQGFVALATGLAIVGASLYLAFRFRPSRGIAVLTVTTGATTIAYGVLAGLHFIGTTALTSVAMPVVAVTTLLASLFYLSTEKAMLKESHLVLDEKTRKEIMAKSLGKSAAPMLVFMLTNIYIAINFFAFGVENSVLLFASAIFGELVAVAALLCVMGPLACAIGKGFSKIHLPKIKLFEKSEKEKAVKKTSEPEETIFIGIND